mmetsp:Transcript_31683/g.67126  ORF Transcript_31683/g.67126 Transcript_31683/m.67126 type:complete len:175 (+) Transcript_31683:80-604(+)|eukprot:CAMPEP_0171343702 /NCGR_PEP_ID=MMETSP0878-20121228/17811_1 /TAXON_ID=67004 /ORGANISM="Thalassiosira weissflogii, Strain CCMP1336" /LENGTH=174 /DNA_ID=CAMNT_0011846707 /DNA_START=55 /DNA_END=579 /DNA_ORIENTATION=-
MKLPQDEDEVRRNRRPSRRGNADNGRLSASAHIPRNGINEVSEPQPGEGEDARVPISINLANYSDEDLEELRRSDPFMYFSIPSVRSANLRHETYRREPVRRNSLPAHGNDRSQNEYISGRDNNQGDQEVLRQSRISFEAHSSVILSELLDSLGDDGSFDDGNDDDGSFDSLFH